MPQSELFPHSPWDSKSAEKICRWIESLLAHRGKSREWLRHYLVQIPNLKNILKASDQERLAQSRLWSAELRDAFKNCLNSELWEGESKPFLSFLHPHFPARLQQTGDPPCGLYFKGVWKLLRRRGPWIAVVGTRAASPYALKICRELVRDMAPYRPVIVSGMARGIDAVAHQAAIDFEMATVGVLGTDIDRVYPRENAALFARMASNGLLLSEIPATAQLGAWRFPERNRLIAALSEAIIVVEAPRQSGALLTAVEALDLGKEIFVVPGPMGEGNAGGHRLIQQGAHLLRDVREIFRLLGYRKKTGKQGEGVPTPEAFTPDESRILAILKEGPAQIDKVALLSQLALPSLAVTLTTMVLREILQEHPGKIFEINREF